MGILGEIRLRREMLETEISNALYDLGDQGTTAEIAQKVGEDRKTKSPVSRGRKPWWVRVDNTMYRLAEQGRFNGEYVRKKQGVVWSRTPQK